MLHSPYNKPRLTPPGEHPRLMFKEEDRKRIEENLNHPENRRAYELWQAVCKKDFRFFYDDIKAGKYNLMVCFMIESKAFEAWLTRDEKKARELIGVTIKILDLFVANRKVNLMICRHTGHLVFVASLMYDWLYEHLTEEEKTHIIERCEQMLAASMEIGYPPNKQRGLGSHSHETQLLRDMLGFSIAVYDERPDIYDYCAGRLFHDFVPLYAFTHSGGLSHQGPAYGAYRHCSALWCQLIFYAMSGEKIFDECVESMADSYYYLSRADGEGLRIGDDCNDDKGGCFTARHPFTVVSFLAGAITGNEQYRQYFFDNYRDEFMLPSVYDMSYYKYGCYGEGIYSPVVHLVFNRIVPTYTPKKPEKAKHFPYPNGVTIYKDEEKGTTVYMKVGELWSPGHDHYDTGDFQIYHNGILLSSSGAYYSWGNYHFYNYLIRTSAHNCLTVRDPSVTTLGQENMYPNGICDILNDGGTKIPKLPHNYPIDVDLSKDWEEKCRMAKVLSHTESDELIELVGDLTEAYSHTCERVKRRMSFEPKRGECGVFTVSDEIVTKSDEFETLFHLHTMSEPLIEGNKITVEHKGGKLICKVLEPANAKIEAIGGGDRRFTLNGIPIPSEKTDHRECGWGQILIAPGDKSREHRFTVEMHLFDATI